MTPPNEHQGFTRIDNPFTTGSPVRERNRFFGREEDFAFARRRLEVEKEGIVLVFKGDRRTGKTSILYQILNGRLEDEFLPVFVDFAGVMGDREFFARMAARTCEHVKDERIIPDHYDFSQGNPTLAFDRLLDDIHQIFPDRRLIFLVDEAEILVGKVDNGELTGNTLIHMANMLESRRISFFFTGSMGLSEREEGSWRLLIGKAQERTIGFLERPDALRLITQPVEGQVFYDEGVVDEIYRLTCGHPFYTQCICSSAVDHLNSWERNELSMTDLEEIVRTLLDDPPASILYTWGDLTREEQITLSLLSEYGDGEPAYVAAETLMEAIEENKYPLPDISLEVLHIQMESLYQREQRDMLDRDAEGTYAFRVDLFRRWVRRWHPIWQLVEEMRPKRLGKPLLVGILGAAAVVLAAVFLLMWRPSEEEQVRATSTLAGPTTGSMVVESTPSGAEVLVNGRVQRDRTPIAIPDLLPGTYFVQVRHELYWPREDSIPVMAGEPSRRRFDLQRLKGTLSVASNPPGAQVRMRGAEVDTTLATPLIALMVPTGDYEMAVTKSGYVAQLHPLTIETEADTTIPLTLEPWIGGLYVASEPPGATILLDGDTLAATTPARLDRLEPREHHLRLELDKYVSVDTTVSVRYGKVERVSFRPRLLPATLDLRSTPSDATIYADDADTAFGRTPKEFTLTPGRHVIRLWMEGYDGFTLEKEFLPDEKYTENVPLVRQYGSLRIAFVGTVIVGDQEVSAPKTISLPVGKYIVRIKGESEGQEVTITKDKMETVRLR